MKQNKLKIMLECCVFAALLCIFSPLAIYFGPVPITLSLFFVMLCGVILPWRQSLLSVLLYLLLGLVGLPVFAGGVSGVTAFPGPTGGYLWSFAVVAPMISLLSQQTPLARIGPVGAAIGCLAGVLLCYSCGTLQFVLLTGSSVGRALSVCVVPFLLPDAGKTAAAAVVGYAVRRILFLEKERNF